jgi:hypothetical protein
MRAHLNTLSNKPPIAYLDQAYSPTGVQYLREGFYSASPDHLAIEYGGTTDHRGYYQIEILTPSNSGAAAGMDKATLLAEQNPAQRSWPGAQPQTVQAVRQGRVTTPGGFCGLR